MGWSDKPFMARYQTMGDEAEEVFESVHPLGKSARFGWRRPKGISMRHMPSGLRHMPDYYVESGYLVEVMGLGKDGILKSMKLSKWEAYKIWKRFCTAFNIPDLVTFIWNSHTEEYIILSYEKMARLVAKGRRKFGVKQFSDGNEYIPIPWEWAVEEAEHIGAWHHDR